MRILPITGALLCFCLSLLFAATFCYGDDKNVEVVGIAECADCAQNNIKNSQAFSGLGVTIDCKAENGEFKTTGAGELDKEGKFKVSLPSDIVEDGKLKEECYAQLHSASSTPCPAHEGLESTKIVLKSKTDDKHRFGLAGKLKFSPVTCSSALFWPYYKHPPLSFPPLPKWKHPPLNSFHHPYLYHPLPPKVFPPLPPKVFPPKPPIVFPPLPPKVFPPKPPVVFPPLPPKVFPPKSLPPPIVKKPCPPIVKKPLPPFVPIYKPPVPKVLPPPIPIYNPQPKPPTFYKPLPPIPKIPPFPKKPFPPLP